MNRTIIDVLPIWGVLTYRKMCKNVKNLYMAQLHRVHKAIQQQWANGKGKTALVQAKPIIFSR